MMHQMNPNVGRGAMLCVWQKHEMWQIEKCIMCIMEGKAEWS